MRLDQALKAWGFAPSRAKAQELIATKSVEVFQKNQWRVAESDSLEITSPDQIRIVSDDLLRFVSRAGLKLEGALEYLNLSVAGADILDVGLSTGGFSDCLLQRGANRIVGVDVGHDQLSPKLRNDSRLVAIDGFNARNIEEYSRLEQYLPDKADLCVVDVSFISLEKLLPAAVRMIKSGGALLALVKPQFELDRNALNKKGVVADSSHYPAVEAKIRSLVSALGFNVAGYFPSPISGQDGNREFFVYGVREKRD